MDKVKQNIIQQQQLDKFNIEKSVIGTEAYYINQDIQKGLSGDEIIEKAKSGVYKLTAENKKMGRVGQKYGESKKEEDDPELRNLETRLISAKDFAPHKVEYYEKLIKEHKENKLKEPTDKKEYDSDNTSEAIKYIKILSGKGGIGDFKEDGGMVKTLSDKFNLPKEKIVSLLNEHGKSEKESTEKKEDKFPSKDKLIEKLISFGNNAENSKDMVEKHYDYVKRVYPDSSLKELAMVIRTIY